ncbi:phosphate/phosphite/phosphonate ABC transporter substrate-binding protein [Halalkalibacterium halodurans]|jgi:phosphonate transport system substrate-binding protein|uniref:BH0439 protein n=2 Tax=Halalkalibacterium halodurans TaxID=86665 RepID=Q9KFP0_HALH5|nr:phosphate/phosphite/phosphonate ABC transporter substrate-binding protein [Halalkalibacterium halodurans]MDY7220940.1 phosphate/phosphite/phosphonate ABC transporter substrate-binding protein [Halalkalibacterium halodurans]MDY7240179.1 phosphate/phosphite/phosphonate ABC transporter substrate-binding protein [Halalkalibacterium halodurans]MED3646509.1 phosphate/phosphite/phosphonate ABC transporter substrate-binding protein [Halalkalibacterium halodurans]MED4082514.1 phosphate/phosphite/phos
MGLKKAGASLLLATSLFLTACGSSATDSEVSEGDAVGGTDSEAYVPESLMVQFVPSQNAETLEARAKPLENLLSDELGIDVEVSVSTNYNTVVEAMASGQVDVGFLPPNAYVQAHDEYGAAEVILQSQRFGVNEDGSPTDELVDYYLSMFIARADSDIESIADIKGKTVAFQDYTSSAGYVWPAAILLDEGIDPLTDVNPLILQGHDAGVTAVLNGEADVAAIFQDARNVVAGDFPTVFEDTKVISFTEPIPNDTISVRSDMDDEWKKKIQQAFIKIGQSEEGLEIIRDIYTHEGYTESEDATFDIVRDYAERVQGE